MVKRKFKNIYGKQINVLTKPMKPEEILELELPEKTIKNTYREKSEIQEIINLLTQKYIQEIIEEKKK